MTPANWPEHSGVLKRPPPPLVHTWCILMSCHFLCRSDIRFMIPIFLTTPTLSIPHGWYYHRVAFCVFLRWLPLQIDDMFCWCIFLQLRRTSTHLRCSPHQLFLSRPFPRHICGASALSTHIFSHWLDNLELLLLAKCCGKPKDTKGRMPALRGAHGQWDIKCDHKRRPRRENGKCSKERSTWNAAWEMEQLIQFTDP